MGTQRFLSLIDPDSYHAVCPIGDGEGSFEHYLQDCEVSDSWRVTLSESLGEEEPFPTVAELLQSHTPAILSLLDHSSLGTPTFVQRRDLHFHHPRRRFWSSPKPRYPTPGYDSLWDLEPYRPPSERLPPSRPGPQTWLTDYQRLVIPDQSFVRRCKLPPLRWDQHSVPRLPANPLAEHGSQPSSPLSVSTDSTLPDHPLPRRSTRIAQRAPPPVAEHWQPPG